MLYMATGKPAHLGCKFLLDMSVVNSHIVVELLVVGLERGLLSLVRSIEEILE